MARETGDERRLRLPPHDGEALAAHLGLFRHQLQRVELRGLDEHTAGLERHHVVLTDHEVVFVFEADEPDAVERLAADPTLWDAMSGWSDLVAGPPRIAEDVYSWIRAHPSEEVSFAATPGPGDSEGGDVFPPVRRSS